MRRPSLLRRAARRTLHRSLAACATGALVVGLLAVGASLSPTAAPTVDAGEDLALAAANPPTPGTFTGLGFDQCETVSESAMRTWRRSSPFRAVGIYISGNSRACKRQTNLTPSWVTNQLADGWKLLPITLGPQASCSSRYPKYGANVDPTINPSPAGNYAAAQAQGAQTAREAVAAATNLGIVPGSTLFYDLEAFNLAHSTDCLQSALWFTHAWTSEVRRLGYVSGFYSSAASGIKMLDDERVRAGGSRIALPDQLWIADWDGKANTSSRFVRSDGWQPASRVKQYLGGHNETWGGVTINIDSNYMVLRQPGAVAPAPVAGPSCTAASVNRAAYRRTGPARTGALVALQCALRERGFYTAPISRSWNPQTTAALNAFQRSKGRTVRGFASRGDWVALHTAGNTRSGLGRGAAAGDLVRLQRALNAATGAKLRVTGGWNARTARVTKAYQRKVKARSSAATWVALERGRW